MHSKDVFLLAADVRIENESIPSDRTSSNKNPTTPPSSHSESSESPLSSCDEAYSPAPKRKRIASLFIHLTLHLGQKRTAGKQGMVNGSRLVLCCFMLCVLITNPFNYFLNLIHASDSNTITETQSIITSRTLQSAANNENINSSSKNSFIGCRINSSL